MGFDIAAVTLAEFVALLVAAARSEPGGGYVLTLNTDALRQATESPTLARVVEAARLRAADGMPLVWMSRVQGTPLPSRVAGSDLIYALSEKAAAESMTVFLLGGNPGTAFDAGEELTRRFPSLQVVGADCPPLGFESDPDEMEAIVSRVRESNAHFVYIGLPFRLASELASALCDAIPGVWCLGLGVSFSFVSGELHRAPRFMQRLGLEWLHRLVQEPQRLTSRYLIEGPPFLLAMGRSALARRGSRRQPPLAQAPAPGDVDGVSLVTHHFGPASNGVGGMASMMRTTVEQTIGADQVIAHPTWHASSPVRTARAFVGSIGTVATLPRPALVHVHLSERGSFVREGSLLILARLRGHVTAATLHGADYGAFADDHPRLVKRVLRAAKAIICLDPGQVNQVAALAPGSVVRHIPNPVLLDRLSPPASASEPMVLFAGEVGLRKGADVLRRAWPQVREAVPDAECVLAGPPTGLQLAPAAGLRVMASVPPDQIKLLIRQSRCVALPSRAEALPMFLLEAMAAARPFVSTRVGGIPALAAGGVLVPQDDPEALAEELIRLLKEPELADALGSRGQALCAELYGPESVGPRVRSLYADCSRR
jgi:N-acetylglucosaminyldiphosphoundecaprenol N-acetyl-beta-D-mannosaminyltransferase